MFSLTQREQIVILMFLGILFLGFGVREYRQALSIKHSLPVTRHSLLVTFL